MNGKDLLEKMSEVDPRLIEDADKITEEQQPRKKRALFIGITSGMATVAAALVIVAVIGTNSIQKPSVDNNSSIGVESANGGGTGYNTSSDSTDKTTTDPGAEQSSYGSGDLGNSGTEGSNGPEGASFKAEPVDDAAFAEYGSLPKITNKDYGIRGMGGSNANTTKRETSLLPSELEIRSPWSVDAQLKTLPVYLSNSTTPDVDKMKEHVKSAAAALGISESELEITDDSMKILGHDSLGSYRKTMEDQGVPEDEIERELERVSRYMGASISVTGKANGITLNLYTDYSMKVSFDEPYVALQNGRSLGENATENEKRAATEYLAEKYKTLLGYEKAEIAQYGEYMCDFRVYEAAGDLTAQIVNYSLKNARFIGHEDPAKMNLFWVLSTENLEKLGDYPIYTPQQALWVLSSDSTPEENRLPADAEIVKADIVYNNRQGYTAVLPYYEFYVKSDREPLNEGETEYDVYTIAAVPEQFIDMEIGNFGVRA